MSKTTFQTRTINKLSPFIIALLLLSGCSSPDKITPELIIPEEIPHEKIIAEDVASDISSNSEIIPEEALTEETLPKEEEEEVTEVFSPLPKENVSSEVTDNASVPSSATFTKESIPEEIRAKMLNVTINDSSHVTFDDLSYLTITYYGYDDAIHEGHLVVDKELADEVLAIFSELYSAKFPIEKMLLPCEYGGVDELSMQANNTSAFNDRPIEGSGNLSYHQLGRAIDINPLINPYFRFSDGAVLPTTAHKYLDRTLSEKGMITAGSICVQIFEKYGWTWGGNWNTVKDYQHFEKN